MSTASVADLVESLRKGRLLDAARMEKVLKAQDRFPDAVTLAKELVRRGWLTREQVQELLQGKPAEPVAAPVNPAEAPASAAPPSRGRAWLLVLLALLLLGGAGGFGWWWHKHGRNDGQADASNRSTDPQQGSPIGGCTDTSDLKTLEDLVFGDSVRAKFDPTFLDALKAERIPEVERYKSWQPTGLTAILGEHRMRNSLIAANPDGTLLAVGGDQDTFIRIGPVETLHEKVVLPGHTSILYALAWSPKGDLLASASADGTVRLWDVRDLEQIPPPKVLEQWTVTCLAFSHDGKYLIGGSAAGAEAPGQGLLWVWDVEKRQKRLKKLTIVPVQSVAFSPAAGDYRALWAGGPGDAKVHLWDFNPEVGAEGNERAKIDVRDPKFDKVDSQSFVGTVAFAPDGKRAVSAQNVWNPGDKKTEWSVFIWDLDHFEKGQQQHTLTGFLADPMPVFAPDGKTIATAHRTDYSVALWEADTGKLLRPVVSVNPIWSLRFLPRGERKDDRVIYTSSISNDRNIHIHEAATGKEVQAPIGHLGLVRSVAGSPDGRHIASGGYEGHARVWDMETLEGRPPVGAGVDVWNAGFHPDGSKAFYCGQSTATVLFLDARTGQPVGQPFNEAHPGGITNAVISEDGHYLLSGGYSDHTVRLWNLKTGDRVRKFDLSGAGPATVALSPTGKRALRTLGHHPPAVKDSLALLHLRCQQPRKEWNGGSWNTYLPDGRVAIIGDPQAPKGKIIDVTDDESKDAGTLGIDLVGASPGSISRDGGRLATILSGRAAVFDLKSHEQLWEWTPPAHFRGVGAVALSDDGRYLFTANGDGTVYVIQLP